MRKAFTLIELLVVMAIGSLLAAMLFPVFAQARESARQTVCLSNMRQIGMAARLYLSDYDERWNLVSARVPVEGLPGLFVSAWLGYDTRNGRAVYEPALWPIVPGLLDPYIKNEGIKRCPSMPREWQLAYALNYWRPEGQGAQGDEFGPCSRRRGRDFAYVPAQDSEVERPADTLLVWEHRANGPLCYYLQPPVWGPGTGGGEPPDDPDLRGHFHFLHRGGANVVWADGHARRMIYDSLRRPMFSCRKDIY